MQMMSPPRSSMIPSYVRFWFHLVADTMKHSQPEYCVKSSVKGRSRTDGWYWTRVLMPFCEAVRGRQRQLAYGRSCRRGLGRTTFQVIRRMLGTLDQSI